MPWGIYTLALVIVWLLQTTVLPLLHIDWLDLLLVLALVCGMAAPVTDARIAGWITGFAQDLGSAGPMGLNAFVLGLAVLALTYLREWTNQNVWWARWLVAFSAAFPARLLVALHLRFLQGAGLTWSRFLADALLSSVVAALLAAAVLGLPALVAARRPRRTVARW